MDGLTVVVIILGFLGSRAVGGIVGDYAKRAWYKWCEPRIAELLWRVVQRRKSGQRDNSRAENKLISDSMAETTEAINRLLARIDVLEAENIKLTARLGAASDEAAHKGEAA